MPIRPAILVALLLAGSAPFAAAAPPACYNEPARDELLAGVSAGGTLYYAAVTDPTAPGGAASIGIYRETNGADGLQARACAQGATIWRQADARVGPALLA